VLELGIRLGVRLRSLVADWTRVSPGASSDFIDSQPAPHLLSRFWLKLHMDSYDKASPFIMASVTAIGMVIHKPTLAKELAEVSGLANTGEKIGSNVIDFSQESAATRGARNRQWRERPNRAQAYLDWSGGKVTESTSISTIESQRAATEAPLTAAAKPMSYPKSADQSTISRLEK